MELRMNFNTFIKLKDASKINDISGEILEYELNEQDLKGVFLITGSYLKDNFEETVNFKEEVEFDIVFLEDVIDINDIDCYELDYCLVDGRGIDVSFDLLVDYEVKIDERNSEIIKAEVLDDEITIDNSTTEEIKEEITKDIERKLFDSLSYKEDNHPTEESFISRISESKRSIKVVYYDTDSELEKICRDNNKSINEVFKENAGNDIDKYQRVIIK